MRQRRSIKPDFGHPERGIFGPHTDLNTGFLMKIEEILGAKGELKDGVLRFTFGKTARMHGQTVGAAMGVNTWAAFAGSDGQAAVDGDFAMEEDDLQTVLKALRKGGIDVVAIHNH